MSQNLAVLDFIQDLDGKRTAQDVGHAFQRLIERFGFHYFCIGALKRDGGATGTVWATSLRHPWFRHWIENRYFHVDPVIWCLKRRRSEPFRWSKLRDVEAHVPHIAILDEAATFGIRDGWATAFQFGGADVSTIGIGLGASRYELQREDELSLHLATVYCSLRLAQLQLRHRETCNGLSERERECLRWVATGKTDGDIAGIIGISQETVHKHVSNALRKLNAATRAQAVAVALTTTQITL